MKKLRIVLLACLLVAAFTLGACTDSTTQGTPSQTGTPSESNPSTDPGTEPAPSADNAVIKIGLPGDTGGYDPATGTTDTPQQIIKATYRGLFSVNADGTLHNELCTDYTLSDDGLVYTFNLRDDVKWSDGVIVTAHDFVYGWQRNLVPELRAAYADLLAAIVNFEECMAGEKELSEFGVVALDDFTLQVTLDHTQPYFVQQTTFSPFYPVRQDKVPLGTSEWSIDVADVVCNGPFMFESYSPNEKIILIPNPESYIKDEVKLERMEFYFIPDGQTAVAAFKNGEVDMAYMVPSDINETHDNPNEVVKVPYLVNNILIFSNQNAEVVRDVRVREAMTIAIDREQICQILGGTAEPLYAIIPPGVTNPATGVDFRQEGGDLIVEDVARAQQLLADAGYPNGEGFPEIEYLYNNDNGMHADIAQAMQGMLKENLGINIRLNGVETQAFSEDRRAGKFDLGRFGTSADYNDPMTWLALYDSSTAYIERIANYKTPEYDEIIHASDLELDDAKRFEMLHEAEKVLVDTYWWLPIMTYDKQILVKEYVKDYYTSTAGDIFVYCAYLDK